MELEKLNVFIEINGVNQLVGNISGILSGNAVFTYTDEYISNPDSRPISISLPLEEKSFDSFIIFNIIIETNLTGRVYKNLRCTLDA